ncbi:metalloprotease TldD [Pollutimonas thiosulfatoxidans]|uniref:Metalloprotease TldD n=1 Tax=Pollutimonas thiosulfatoxidans TaxID=2028345 RepID=A0A410GBN4_9BURK|nr:metalloprotease TldD [Pollutimonas thiosulfatoxidans]QAA93707.1 metalloprotease TldD [Pollutimonas thiosulfatoxidans]
MKVVDPAVNALATAKSVLLDPWGLTESDMARALGEIFTHRVDYADLYFQYTRSESWSLEEGIVKTGSFSIEQGVGVRALSGEKTAFAYSDTLSPEALLSSAHAVRTIARQGAGKQKVVSGHPPPGHMLYPAVDPLNTLSAPDKVTLLGRIESMARAADPRIIQVMAGLGAEYDVILVAGSDGRLAADVRPLVRLSLTVIAEHEGRREMGHGGGGGRTGLDYFTDDILLSYVERATHEALTNLQARPAPAGEMTVVLGSGWPGILLHEAVGHGLEGDFNRKGSSVFSGRIGERVASPGVTVIDDGTIADRRGSLNIDDEGNPTQRNVLIEDGILKGYMQDSLNARLMKMPVTGNGRRESYAHLPMPRMTNTYMLAGGVPPAEIIASVKNGLYAANFGGGQVDITSGKFVFSASEAYLIKNGKITHPVKGATLIGSGPEAMNRISMIGDDLRLDSGVGTCGKEGQSVPVGVGMPTVRMDGLTVGGTG